jgi:hypothetical protein
MILFTSLGILFFVLNIFIETIFGVNLNTDKNKNNNILACYAQEQQLSTRAKEIKEIFDDLTNDLSNIEFWKKYLTLFPKNEREFKNIFDPDNFMELYHNSSEFIFIFEKAPKKLNQDIFKMFINITRDGAPGCCDAWSALQATMTEYVLNYTDIFLDHLKPLTTIEKMHIIKFIADIATIEVDNDYQQIINILENKRESDLVIEFKKARQLRMLEDD